MSIKRILFFIIVLSGSMAAYSLSPASSLMVEKNLFAQDRKPPSQESAVSAGQPIKPGMGLANIQLDGVMIQGNSRKAILRLKTPPAHGADKKKPSPFVTVREGQQVGDYRVVKIEPKSIALEKDGQTHTVALFSEHKVSTPAAPVPPPAQPVMTRPGNASRQQQPVEGGMPAANRPGMQPQMPGRAARDQAAPRQMPPPVPGTPGFIDPNVNPPQQQNAMGQAEEQEPGPMGPPGEEEE